MIQAESVYEYCTGLQVSTDRHIQRCILLACEWLFRFFMDNNRTEYMFSQRLDLDCFKFPINTERSSALCGAVLNYSLMCLESNKNSTAASATSS